MQSAWLPRTQVGYFFLKCKLQNLFKKHSVSTAGISVCPSYFLQFWCVFFFTPRVLSITRMHSKQRHAVVRDPLAAGEQQEAYRWAPCPRKTKIARWQTGLQCISRPVLRQWWQWAVTGEAWSELATQKGKTLQFAAHYSSINSMITSKSHDHQNQTRC